MPAFAFQGPLGIVFARPEQISLSTAVKRGLKCTNTSFLCDSQRPAYGFEQESMHFNWCPEQEATFKFSSSQFIFESMHFEQLTLTVEGDNNYVSFNACTLGTLVLRISGCGNHVHAGNSEMCTVLTDIAPQNTLTCQDTLLHSLDGRFSNARFEFNGAFGDGSHRINCTGGSIAELNPLESSGKMVEFERDAYSSVFLHADGEKIPVGELQGTLEIGAYTQKRLQKPRCCVCLFLTPDRMLLPCHHLCLCSGCADTMQKNISLNCPLCRSGVETIMPVIFSCA